MELLPADFKLPALIRFVPNRALREAADAAAERALAIVVTGSEGLALADTAVGACRAASKAIEAHLEEPCATAFELHRGLTSTRGEWRKKADDAVKIVAGRIYTEQERLKAIEAEARRKEQDAADRKAKEDGRLAAEAAAAAKAPEPVVQQLLQEAATATAPPVSRPAISGSWGGGGSSGLKHNTSVKTYKARIVGTPGEDEPNPEITQLSPAQRLEVFKLLRGILAGTDPLASIALDWSYLNKRAKADEKTMAISGIEAFEVGSVRAKAQRGAR